jgi:hypothetical protein
MDKWKIEDVAYFASGSTTAGRVWCAICPWTYTLESGRAFPEADETIEAHLAEIHPNHMNDMGIQKTPRDSAREGGAELIYYIIIPAVTAN